VRYTEYIRETLDLLDINVNNLEMKEYENWTTDFSEFFFNIRYRSKIGKRLVRAVEIIFYKPLS